MAVTKAQCGIMMCIIYSINAQGQDLENIFKSPLLDAAGQIQTTQIYNSVYGKLPSRKPYGYLFSGSLNFKIAGFIDAPFQFLYSNQGGKYTQPHFNQTAFHPKYKWVQIHIGSITNTWSPYTLNGHLYSGVCLEITPAKWHVEICHGTFLKAVKPDGLVDNSNVALSFSRKGTGVLVGHKMGKKAELKGNVFYAIDDKTSVHLPIISDLKPRENLCMGISGNVFLNSKVKIFGDVANSLLANDINIGSLKSDNPIKTSFMAVKLGSDLVIYKRVFNINYERVDPGYTTLGAYYFNNDLEKISVGTSQKLFKDKLKTTCNIGKQKDNLKNQNLLEMKRTAVNVSAEIKPTTGISGQISYSNFLTYSNIRPNTDFMLNSGIYSGFDTLAYRQIARNYTLNSNFNLKTDSHASKSIYLSSTLQINAEQNHGQLQPGSTFINSSMGYQYLNRRNGTTTALAINISKSGASGTETLTVCPVISIAGGLKKYAIRWNISGLMSLAYLEKNLFNRAFNLRGGMSKTFGKLHNLNMNVLFLNGIKRKNTVKNNFRESTVTFNYSLNLKFSERKGTKGGKI